ncbi:hypothetical protein WJX81_007960 [Elliptochloris bilobata]|uniref:Uncharacterized protein n=1 Tax=Elliptochloris bilobata TaxID=381761 RepID=A0AAW1SIK2_9CHLO
MKVLGRLTNVELHPSECLRPRKKSDVVPGQLWSSPLYCPPFARTLFRACTAATTLRFCQFGNFGADLLTQLLAVVVASCKSLEEVHLESSCVMEGGLAHLAKLPRLRVLTLAFCSMLDSGVALLTPGFTALRELNLSWCSKLRTQSLKHIGPRLRVLHLHGCEYIDDTVCPLLRNVVWLDLAFTHVGDLAALAKHAKRLRELTLAHQALNIWHCGKWTAESLAALEAASPDVSVHFVHC